MPRSSNPSPQGSTTSLWSPPSDDLSVQPADVEALRKVAAAQDRRYRTLAQINWPSEFRMAVNFTVDYDAMLLRRLLEEPPMQLAKGEFGGRVGIWRLIELFDKHEVTATIFTPGRVCELYPDTVRAASASGHEIADHMWEHRVSTEPEIERAHLLRTAEAIERLTGGRPVGTRSYHSQDLLHELGFVYNSITSADVLPYSVVSESGTQLVNLPFHYVWDDAMYFNFAWANTENAAQRMADPDRVLDLWWDAIWRQYQVGGYVNICLHPEVSGRALRIRMLDQLITRIKELPGVWLPSCAAVAAHFLGQVD